MASFNLFQHFLQALTLKAHAGNAIVNEKARIEKVVFVCVLLENDLLATVLSRIILSSREINSTDANSMIMKTENSPERGT